MSLIRIIIAGLITIQLSGCAVAVFGGAAATTAAVASDRRAVGVQVQDHEIEQTITRWIENDPELYRLTHVNVVCYNRHILLVGQVPSEYVRERILDLASEYPDFSDIYNELRVAEKTGAGQRTKDAWLTTKVKSRMLADEELDGHQVKVFTENNEVFLMGLLTPREKKIALTIARNMAGVERVIDVIQPYEKPAVVE
ncbi:BON domain-containing protein [Catenovulum sediminis]|uniref:BON domain-containing protein n=1 Tax=Catenovulum sediminis TaxID=1740262 RepID=UPI0011808A56|nr:BON domain-containing protein [Catenovulum sediminis]